MCYTEEWAKKHRLSGDERLKQILELTKEDGSISYRYYNQNINNIHDETDKEFYERIERIKKDKIKKKELDEKYKKITEEEANYADSISPVMGAIFRANRRNLGDYWL